MSGLEDAPASFNLATHFLDRNLHEGRGGRVALYCGEAALRPGEIPFAAAAARQSDQLEPAPTSRDDEALWKFTTGSTGSPKAAVHRAYDPVVSFDSYARGVLGYEESDRVLPVPKLFFG